MLFPIFWKILFTVTQKGVSFAISYFKAKQTIDKITTITSSVMSTEKKKEENKEEGIKETVKYKVCVFDLDETLVHYDLFTPLLFPDTIEILKFAKDNGVKLCIASHNYGSETLLKYLGIVDYFDYIFGYYDTTHKQSHLQEIIDKYNVSNGDIIFFDDTTENIQSGRDIGINSVLVNFRKGIKLETFKTLIIGDNVV